MKEKLYPILLMSMYATGHAGDDTSFDGDMLCPSLIPIYQPCSSYTIAHFHQLHHRHHTIMHLRCYTYADPDDAGCMAAMTAADAECDGSDGYAARLIPTSPMMLLQGQRLISLDLHCQAHYMAP